MYIISLLLLAISGAAIVTVLILLMKRNDRRRTKYITECNKCGSQNLQLNKIQDEETGISKRNVNYSEYTCMDCGNTITEVI